ncbi:haloacid dehalogenase type II [Pelagibacteraceae bacterium]|nr:haloacid dehalogenase type II [Pelagibacteraceae bacterium]
MKIENIKACVFDAYGTLFDVNSAASKCKEKLGSKWEGFANAWRTTQLEYTWLRSLMKKHKNFWEITEDSLDHTMETFKIKKEMKNELLDLYKKLSPYSEVKECLEELKAKKIKIAILSNGTPDLLKGLVENNNIQNYFDDIFSIESVGIYKPDARVYEMPINKYDCKPENICFMSSNTWDVSGGGVFGYTAVWVNRLNKVFDKLGYKPKYVINNLEDLLKII